MKSFSIPEEVDPDTTERFVRRVGTAPDRQKGATHERIVNAFMKNPCLSRVPTDVVWQLVDAGYEKTWLHGELVLRHQEPCMECHIVSSGALEVSWSDASGARVIGEYLHANEVINIIPAFDSKGSLADIRAHGTTTVFHIPRAAILTGLDRSHELTRAFFELIAMRSREQYTQLRFQRIADFHAKVAERLLSLAARHGRKVEGGVTIGFKLSQDNLAAMLGVARQSINRELRNLADLGCIEISYGKLTILDWDALVRMREMQASGRGESAAPA